VIASKHEEVLGVFNLVCEHKTDGLDGLFASIYIISQEEIVGLSRKSSIFE
jgi:hypothetical protein